MRNLEFPEFAEELAALEKGRLALVRLEKIEKVNKENYHLVKEARKLFAVQKAERIAAEAKFIEKRDADKRELAANIEAQTKLRRQHEIGGLPVPNVRIIGAVGDCAIFRQVHGQHKEYMGRTGAVGMFYFHCPPGEGVKVFIEKEGMRPMDRTFTMPVEYDRIVDIDLR